MEDIEMKLKIVLIVEGNDNWRIQYAKELEGIVKIIFAKTLEEAEEIFEKNCDELDAVGIASHINSSQPNSMELVRGISKKLSSEIPIFAITATLDARRTLIDAGCNRGSNKKDFPAELCEVLGVDIFEYVA